MSCKEELERIVFRLKHDEDDIRHTVLEISDAFLSIAADRNQFPAALRTECDEIVAELQDVQPLFKSQRQTSVLFDRAGMGKPGRERAENLSRRIIGLVEMTLRELQ